MLQNLREQITRFNLIMLPDNRVKTKTEKIYKNKNTNKEESELLTKIYLTIITITILSFFHI